MVSFVDPPWALRESLVHQMEYRAWNYAASTGLHTPMVQLEVRVNLGIFRVRRHVLEEVRRISDG